LKENALSSTGLCDLRLTFSPAWVRNFVAACGLADSTAAYGGGLGVYISHAFLLLTIPKLSTFKNCRIFLGHPVYITRRPHQDGWEIFLRNSAVEEILELTKTVLFSIFCKIIIIIIIIIILIDFRQL